jgi:hypothetical protein
VITASQLIHAAEQMIGNDGSSVEGALARGVALLTRQAIGVSLADLWSQRSPGVAKCSARIQLICLSAAGLDENLSREVRHTWSLLSAACHDHPYDVAPPGLEVSQWVRVAARLHGAMFPQR